VKLEGSVCVLHLYYPHMPIGKVWIYQILFMCVLVYFVYLYGNGFFFAEDKASTSNFARLFIGIQGRESPILGNFASPEAQNRPVNQPARALNYT